MKTQEVLSFRQTGLVTWSKSTEAQEAVLTFKRVPFIILLGVVLIGYNRITKSHHSFARRYLLEHFKYLTFHNNVKPGERFFWYTTTGWMMWNFSQSSLLCGATLVLYDGSPGYPDLRILWSYVRDAGFTTSAPAAGFILSQHESRNTSRIGFSLVITPVHRFNRKHIAPGRI